MPGLGEDLENEAILIDRLPEPMLIAATVSAPTDAVGEFRPESLMTERPRAANISSVIRRLGSTGNMARSRSR
jgi:hypothetical protein